MPLNIPARLAATCSTKPEHRRWLKKLPEAVRTLQRRWGLQIEEPFNGSEGNCAWVAPAMREDGTKTVLKLGMPHMEGEHEIQGLKFWNGDPTVHILEADEELNGMLLECCEPGTTLRQLPEHEQDSVLAELLRRLWRRPHPSTPFRHLSAMAEYWMEETMMAESRWPDAGLVREGIHLFRELSLPSTNDVLLATDLHAGNVLRAEREPWLVIDPKPFIGDPAYDATQHLFNCRERLLAAPNETIRRFADLLEVDHEPVRLWTFARAAAEPRDVWDGDALSLARSLRS